MAFSLIFALLKLTCLVTLFDRKQKLAKIDHFWHFWLTFVNSKCIRISLRSQCCMRLFLWFSNTVRVRGSFFDVASSVGWAAEPLIFAWESGNMVEILSKRANQFSSFSGVFFRTAATILQSNHLWLSTALFSVIKSKASITDWNATLSLPSACCFLMTFFLSKVY